MAKGDRKRTQKLQPKMKAVDKNTLQIPASEPLPNILKQYPVRTLTNADAERFKGLVMLSNNVAGLLKSIADADMSIAKGREISKEMLSGEIRGPAMRKVSANLYLPLFDIKGTAKKITKELDMIEQANIISIGQLQQRYDEYVDAIKAMRHTLDTILADAKNKEVNTIRGDRKSRVKGENIVFEKEFDKLSEKDVDFLKEIGKKNSDKKTTKK